MVFVVMQTMPFKEYRGLLFYWAKVRKWRYHF